MEKRLFDIITDTGCDMPMEYYAEHNVRAVKLGVNMDGVDYEGEFGEALDPKAFYEKIRGGSMPTTYQVTSEYAKTNMEESLKNGRDVLAVPFSSGLSGTAGSFMVAARELQEAYPDRKIIVVDSLCASMGQGLFLDYIIKKADTGMEIEDVAAYAEGLKLQICHHVTVDDLFHLKRGGRVSATTAVVGSMLKIKPILHVDNEGHLVNIGKEMGRKKALKNVVDSLFETMDMDENDPIFISHGDCIEDVEYVEKLLRERLPNVEIKVHYIGAVIGSHAGAGTVAVFNKGKHR